MNQQILKFAIILQGLIQHCLTDNSQELSTDWREEAETEFHQLDQQLRENLKEKYADFKTKVSEATQQHHSKYSCPRVDPMEECYGQASLTESELIFHETLDKFATSIPSSDKLNHLHFLTHSAFRKTRELLLTKSLLQQSEFLPEAVTKQNQMIHKYRRSSETVLITNR